MKADALLQQPEKPCPFCGFMDFQTERLGLQHYAVYCNVCEVYGPMGITSQRAASSWDYRPEEEKPLRLCACCGGGMPAVTFMGRDGVTQYCSPSCRWRGDSIQYNRVEEPERA